MATPFEDIYAAARAIMQDANTAASWVTLTQAPTNYGTDFRITPGQGRYQVQITAQPDYGADSNALYPRVIVTVLVHHYILRGGGALADEVQFLHKTMGVVADYLMVSSTWRAESGIFDLQVDIEPEVENGGRVGNVLTFEISVVVLADAV